MNNTEYSIRFERIKKHLSKFTNVNTPEALNTIADMINEEDERKQQVKNNILKDKIKSEEESDLVNKFGNFYFDYYTTPLDISPQVITRFMYLCCFMDYNNYLKKNKNAYMKLNDLKTVLMLSSTDLYKTKKSLIDNKLLIVDSDQRLLINKKYCVKGKPNKKIDKIRMFEETLKNLYRSSSAREHIKLALLFQLIPFVNFKLNVCCANIFEDDENKIEPYTLHELAALMHQTNITRFRRKLLDITVSDEPTVCIVEILNQQMIAVNPRIYYKGSLGDIEKMEGLGLLFTVAEQEAGNVE